MGRKSARKLAYTVYLQRNGEVVGFGPDSDEIPAWAAEQIGDHAYEPDDSAAAEDGDSSADAGPPPRAGAGSGREAWVEYATANGVEVDDDAKRDDIIAALEVAGVPVE